MCTQTQNGRQTDILAFRNLSASPAKSYGRASRAVVLRVALALLLAATPASRGGPAPPVGPGLARLVRLDRAGFLGASESIAWGLAIPAGAAPWSTLPRC